MVLSYQDSIKASSQDSIFSELIASGTTPTASFNFLTATELPASVVCSRSTEASRRGSDGKWSKVAADTTAFQHAINGTRIGLVNEATRTRINHYPYPASGTVSNHFTTGTSDISVVTNASSPISSDYTNNTSVWRIANTSGSPVTYKLAGTVGSVSPHNIRIWHQIISGDGHAIAQIGGRHSIYTNELFLNSRVGIEQVSIHHVPATTSDQLEIVVPANMTIDITLAEAQTNNIINTRYFAHATSPVLHGIGASATRAAEFIRIENLNTQGYSDNSGSAVVHGLFLGAEQTNAGFCSFYDASSIATDYQYLRPSPNGDTLYFGEGGNVVFASGTFPISGKRRPTPLDMATAWSWSSATGLNFWSSNTYNFTSTNTNTPQNIDTFSLYRHDNAPRDDSTCILTLLEVYDEVLPDSELRLKSLRNYQYFESTVAQSNVDIRMRGIRTTVENNAFTTTAISSGVLQMNYPKHGVASPGGNILVAGATAVDGITAGQINISNPITAIIDADTLEVTTAGSATAGSVTGGGSGANATMFIEGDAGGGDYIVTNFMSEYVPGYLAVRGPDYYDYDAVDSLDRDLDNGGGALLTSSNIVGVDAFVDDTDPLNLADGVDLTRLISTLTDNYSTSGKVKNFHIDLGPYESGRSVEEINGIVKLGLQYLIDRLTSVGGVNSRIIFQAWATRLNTDDEITWAWREMLRELEQENANTHILAWPFNFDLDSASNAHFMSETNYIKTYLQVSRRLLKLSGFADFGNVDAPTIDNATYSGTSITLNFNTEHNANIVSSNLVVLAQLFRVLVDGVEATVTGASTSNQSVTLTLSTPVSSGSTVTIDYPYRLMDYDQDSLDENDAGSAALVDNSCYANTVAQFSNFPASES